MSKSIFCFLFFVLLLSTSYSQLISSAGSDKIICYNSTTGIGGSPSASGGTPPYTFNWQPSTFLVANNVSNPVVTNCTEDILYKMTVTDKDGNTSFSYVKLEIDKIHTFSAGVDTGYCFGQAGGVQIGATNNDNSFHTFNWSPSLGLDDPSSARPISTTSVTIVYQLTVSDGLCPSNISQVTVVPFTQPYADAGLDTTIDEGITITLHGIGGTSCHWLPDYNISYGPTFNPDVWPIETTTYTLITENSHKCYNSDTVVVTVRNGSKLFFYSAFSPNNDGDNDHFYIGNVEKYPDNNLKIYNRYGKLIYSATNYINTWDGTYLGNDVPTGTYFYIFDDGIDQKYKGTVTILR